ncbi:Uncharacterised protein [Salmonella enterica subsp. arizonae]|uniref:Uncharacterized protein n=1 Tax=Salmonella enterica subsp. arizonae TaxID=59203 RepID=A0A2X4TJ83_SALER|nr:Uncharacterised protein [Salmonella enterica subsp. arizonae]
MENLRDQLAVFQVIGGEGGFILGKAAIDLIHTDPRVINGFSFAEQLCETASSEKDEKFQNADLSASMPSIITRPLA